MEAVFASEEFVEAAIMGLKGKYPGISRKVVDLKCHPSSSLYTLSQGSLKVPKMDFFIKLIFEV